MTTAKISTPRFSLAGALVCLGLASVAGVAFASITSSDVRWAMALTAGAAFMVVLLVVPNPRRFLWILFIFSFQFQAPSVRLLYGHAGSEGLMITLPAMLGMLFLAVFIGSGGLRQAGASFRWLGPVGTPFIALLAISVISLAHSDEHFVGIGALLVQLEVYLVYPLALNCVRSEEDLKLTINLLYAALAIQSVVYFFEIAFNISYISLIDGLVKAGDSDAVRPGGTLGTNPFSFTDFVLPIMFILFASIVPVRQAGTQSRWYGIVVLALGMVAIGLTLTRTAYANLFLGFLCVLALGYKRRSVSTRKALAMLGIALVVASLIAPLIIKRVERETMKSSYDERAALMQMAINVIRSNPVFGVGPGAYVLSYKRYLTTELEDKWQWQVHNYYLLRTAENGIFAGIAVFVLLLVALRTCWALSIRSHPMLRALALAGVATVVTTAHAMYWDQWTHIPAQMLFMFILGLMGAAHSMKLEEDRTDATAPARPSPPPAATTLLPSGISRHPD